MIRRTRAFFESAFNRLAGIRSGSLPAEPETGTRARLTRREVQTLFARELGRA